MPQDTKQNDPTDGLFASLRGAAKSAFWLTEKKENKQSSPLNGP